MLNVFATLEARSEVVGNPPTAKAYILRAALVKNYFLYNRGYSRIHPHPLPVRRKARLKAEGIKFQTPPLKKRAAEGTFNGEGGTPLIRRKRLLGEDWS